LGEKGVAGYLLRHVERREKRKRGVSFKACLRHV